MKKKLALILALCMSLELVVTNVSLAANEVANAALVTSMEESGTEGDAALTGQGNEWTNESEVTCQPETVSDNTTEADEFVVDGNGVLTQYNGKGGDVTIPDHVTSIGENVFESNTALTSITIPDSVESIGDRAFSGCSSLTSISIPASVTSIGVRVFSDCSSLASITVEAGNTVYDSRDNSNAIIVQETNTLLRGCNTTIIPDSVTGIGEYAFDGCRSLTSITIPDSVESIGDRAFSGCSSLTSIDIPASVTDVGTDAFSNCSGLADQDGFVIVRNALYGYYNDESEVTIPNNVIKIETGVFFGKTRLTSINIPENLVSIGDKAFGDCSSLTSINIPANVKSIGDGAFSGCSSLESINIPESVTGIGAEAFCDCNSLKNITIPIGVTAIEPYTFCRCLQLESVTIPGSVTSIKESAFANCFSLGSIEIPDGVMSLEDSAFYGCDALKSVSIPTSMQSIGGCAFFGCNLEIVKIPKSVESIGMRAFWCCKNLKAIVIPASVTSIGEGALDGCDRIEGIWGETDSVAETYAKSNGLKYYVYGETPLPALDADVFEIDENGVLIKYNGPGGDVTIPNGVTSIGESAFSSCNSLTSITIPDGVTSIGVEAFYDCGGLISITIPDSVTSIGGGAFSYCSNLTSITIPADVTSIQYCVFYGCSSLKSITIPDNVTSIGNNAFRGCSSLTGITIPNRVTSIGNNVFGDCSSLESITVQAGNNVYDSRDNCNAIIETSTNTLMYGCSTTKIPENVTRIGDSAFYGCSNLKSITISEGVTSIGEWTFNGCSGLESITVQAGNSVYDSRNNCNAIIETSTNTLMYGCSTTKIPENVTSIKESAFYGCSNLTSIAIPEGVTRIGEWTFYGCSSLMSITIPQGVTGIGDYAFTDCSSLISIAIPNGIMSIGADAFRGCSSLESITIPEGVTSIGDSVFYGCSSLTSITIPKSVTTIADTAFDGCSLEEIRGIAGSYAQVYATQKGIKFIDIGASTPGLDGGDEGKTPSGDDTQGSKESEEKKPVVENTTETRKDGTVVTTEKTTYPEGNISLTIITTSKDTKKQTRVDMEIDADKNLESAAIEVSKKVSGRAMTINLKELKKMVDQIEKCNVEYVHPLADGVDAESILTEDGLSGGTEIVSIEDDFGYSAESSAVAGMSLAGKSQEDEWMAENITWANELYVTAKKANISIKVCAKDNKGKDKYSLSIQKKDLTQKKFVVYSSDKKGNPVMTNPKSNNVKVNAKKDMTIKIASKGNYQLQNTKDAAKTNQKIMKTVTPKKQTVTVKKGSSTSFDLSSKCNKANISKITYKPDNSNVSVSAKGKISAKSSGTTKVTANVTMKNGAKKSIKMKVSVS